MISDENKKESEMKRLLDEKQYFNFPKIGDLVKGAVIFADSSEVHLDLSGIATGIVRGKERYGESEEYRDLKPGDEVEATVLELENENGEVELSFRYAGRQKAWQGIKQLEKDGAIVSVQVTDANKGGLMVKLENTVGFLPVSQLSPENYPRIPGGDKNRILEVLRGYLNKKFDVKVIDANEAEEKLIVSEKAAWEETQKHVIDKYKVGEVIEGRVTAITDFGVFVEFDKLEGLIHISEIAWQRIDDPNDFVKVGQIVKAEIISIESSKIFLSMKKLTQDPWEGLEEKYQIGQKVKGRVIKANPFGLFVEIEKDIQGLAHISQLSDKPVADIATIAKPGDEMEFYVVSMDVKNHRLGLGLIKPKEKTAKEETPVEPPTTKEIPADVEMDSQASKTDDGDAFNASLQRNNENKTVEMDSQASQENSTDLSADLSAESAKPAEQAEALAKAEASVKAEEIPAEIAPEITPETVQPETAEETKTEEVKEE